MQVSQCLTDWICCQGNQNTTLIASFLHAFRTSLTSVGNPRCNYLQGKNLGFNYILQFENELNFTITLLVNYFTILHYANQGWSGDAVVSIVPPHGWVQRSSPHLAPLHCMMGFPLGMPPMPRSTGVTKHWMLTYKPKQCCNTSKDNFIQMCISTFSDGPRKTM